MSGSQELAVEFPIDLAEYKPLAIDPSQTELTAEQRDQLKANIQLCRDAIVFFTAVSDAKGLGGHTGGPYDIVPEVLIAARAFNLCRYRRCRSALLRVISLSLRYVTTLNYAVT